MSTKRVIATHVIVGLALGVILGVAAWVSETDGRAHMFLAIPVGIAVLFIGYSGPVSAGAVVVAFLRRRYRTVSMAAYLVAYYALLVLLFADLYRMQDETDSGFAILAVPYLPIPAFVVTVAIAVARVAFRKLRV